MSKYEDFQRDLFTDIQKNEYVLISKYEEKYRILQGRIEELLVRWVREKSILLSAWLGQHEAYVDIAHYVL